MYFLFCPLQHGAFLSSTYNHGEEKKKRAKEVLTTFLSVG